MWLIFLRRCFVLSWTHQSPAESPPVISLWVGTGEDVSSELALFRKPSKKHKLMMAELARMLRPSRAEPMDTKSAEVVRSQDAPHQSQNHRATRS